MEERRSKLRAELEEEGQEEHCLEVRKADDAVAPLHAAAVALGGTVWRQTAAAIDISSAAAAAAAAAGAGAAATAGTRRGGISASCFCERCEILTGTCP